MRYFVAVADELSFTRAAARIPVAVGALSTQIKRLESELGLALLVRTTHSVALTPAGTQFLGIATGVLHALDDGVAAVRRSAPTSTVTVAVVEEGLAELTAPVIAEYRRRFPRIEVLVVPCPAAELFVRIDEFDVLFWIHPGAPFADWTALPIMESDAVVVVSSEHRLASAERLHARDVIDETFVRVPSLARGWFDRHYLDDVRGGPPVALSATEVRDVPGGQSLVSMDAAIMVQPAAKLSYFSRPDLRAIPLDGVDPFPLSVAHRRADERPEIRALVDVAHDVAASSRFADGTRAVVA